MEASLLPVVSINGGETVFQSFQFNGGETLSRSFQFDGGETFFWSPQFNGREAFSGQQALDRISHYTGMVCFLLFPQ
jgi:hypothetical protein